MNKKAVKQNLEKTLELIGMHMEIMMNEDEFAVAQTKTENRSRQTELFASEFSKMNEKLKGKGKVEDKTIRIYKDLKDHK